MSVLTISSFTPQISWPHEGTTATLRIKYSSSFTDSVGQAVLRGLHKDVACTISNGILTVPQFTLITTNDALVNPLVTCSAQFFDSNGAARDWLFQGYVIPQALTPLCQRSALDTYNQGAALVSPPRQYLSRDETVALVTTMLAALGLGPATDLILGIVKLSAAAADPANPVVWEQGDPNARDAQTLKGVILDALVATPADGNVLGFSAFSGTYKPLATATPSLHAISHQDGGTDELDVTGLVGLLATPQVPLPHAVLHENGGADEISVSGLNGLLADAQTPLAHKASHENNGTDEISVVGLSGLLADPQTPLAHKTSHQSGGSDAIKLDDLAAPDDNTDLNASTSAHGLLPKLPNSASQFLNGVGAWSTPSGAGDVGGPGAATDNAIARYDGITGKIIQNSNLTLPDDAVATEVGYMNIPQNRKSANYTTVMADRAGHVYHPASDNNPRTYTIDANADVPYPIGTTITFVNRINTLTIAIDADTLIWADTGGTGSRSLAANGVASALKVEATEWIISGVGLS